MAYLAQLLNDGIFDEIYVSFLPVGHTHEDIDQVSAVHEIQIQKYMIYIYIHSLLLIFNLLILLRCSLVWEKLCGTTTLSPWRR
jgi:hypothetical protein